MHNCNLLLIWIDAHNLIASCFNKKKQEIELNDVQKGQLHGVLRWRKFAAIYNHLYLISFLVEFGGVNRVQSTVVNGLSGVVKIYCERQTFEAHLRWSDKA